MLCSRFDRRGRGESALASPRGFPAKSALKEQSVVPSCDPEVGRQQAWGGLEFGGISACKDVDLTHGTCQGELETGLGSEGIAARGMLALAMVVNSMPAHCLHH